jgi:hypothetical protein
MALKLMNSVRNAIIDAGVVGYFGTATLKVFGGTQPGTGGYTYGTQAIIVEISGITWNAASNGTATITGTKTGTAGTSGTSTWARLSDVSGTAYIIDGACGTAATSDFIIDSGVIAEDAVITLTAATVIQPDS